MCFTQISWQLSGVAVQIIMIKSRQQIMNSSKHVNPLGLTFYLQLTMSDKDKPLGSPTAQVRIGHYILGDTLGVGTFGKVILQFLFCSKN